MVFNRKWFWWYLFIVNTGIAFMFRAWGALVFAIAILFVILVLLQKKLEEEEENV